MNKEKYLELRAQGMSKKEISEITGVSVPTIYNRLREWGLSGAENEANAIRNPQPTPAFDLTAVQWYHNGSDDGVRVVKRGIKVVGSIADKISVPTFAQVGFIKDHTIVIQPAESGWQIKKDPSSAGLIISSQPLFKEAVRRGIGSGTEVPAAWDPQHKMIVARISR